MTTTTHESVGLAATWRLLSLGFTPPTDETLDEVETLADALVQASGAPTPVRAAGTETTTCQRPPSLTPCPRAVCRVRCVTEPKPSATTSSTGVVRITCESGFPTSRPTQ